MKYINVNTGNIFEDNEDIVLKLVKEKKYLKIYETEQVNVETLPTPPKKTTKKRSG